MDEVNLNTGASKRPLVSEGDAPDVRFYDQLSTLLNTYLLLISYKDLNPMMLLQQELVLAS